MTTYNDKYFKSYIEQALFETIEQRSLSFREAGDNGYDYACNALGLDLMFSEWCKEIEEDMRIKF